MKLQFTLPEKRLGYGLWQCAQDLIDPDEIETMIVLEMKGKRIVRYFAGWPSDDQWNRSKSYLGSLKLDEDAVIYDRIHMSSGAIGFDNANVRTFKMMLDARDVLVPKYNQGVWHTVGVGQPLALWIRSRRNTERTLGMIVMKGVNKNSWYDQDVKTLKTYLEQNNVSLSHELAFIGKPSIPVCDPQALQEVKNLLESPEGRELRTIGAIQLRLHMKRQRVSDALHVLAAIGALPDGFRKHRWHDDALRQTALVLPQGFRSRECPIPA